MTHLLYKSLAALTAVALTASCGDFLDKENQDEVIVKTVADYSELLLGSGYPSPTGKLYNTLYLLDDDYQLNDGLMSNTSDYRNALSAFPFFTWQPDMWENQEADRTYYDDSYTLTYERLVGVNAVLDGIDEAIGDATERDYVKAEALALRGYYYFMLANIYGAPYTQDASSLAVPLKLTADIETDGRPRNTVAEVFRQIESDLTASIELFAKHEKRRGGFRINLPAACILLSRLYQQTEDWPQVIALATQAIEAGEPLTNLTLLPAKYTSMSSYSFSEVEWLYGNGYRPCSLPGMKASDELLSLFATDGTDARTKLWFYNGNVKKKALGTPRTPTNAIRMAEAWLNRAEAYAMTGRTAEALADLNHLRQTRYAAFSAPAESTDVLAEIRQERRRELCFDEVRWFDLRRYGMPQITHLYKVRQNAEWQRYILREHDALYTLPIPQAAMSENPALTQNPAAAEPHRQPTQN